MNELITSTEKIFEVKLIGFHADNLRFILRMLIINEFPDEKPCNITNYFRFHHTNVSHYRNCYAMYEKENKPKYQAIKKSFLEKDISFYTEYVNGIKYIERNRERLRQNSKRIEKNNKLVPVKRPKISQLEVCRILRRDVKSPLNNKYIGNWNQNDWNAFNKLKMA